MKAVQYGDRVLRQPATRIEIIDEEVEKIAALMLATLESYGDHGAAIAANQVGYPIAMFTWWDPDTKDPKTVVNPIVMPGSGRWVFGEGCLSLPGAYFNVVRPNHVMLSGTDLGGHFIRIEASEFLGRVFQHEYDHLNGKLFIDRVPEGKKKTAILRQLEKV